jgi:hypothetical protein
MPNINSFTEVVNRLINQTNIAMEAMIQLNKSTTTQDDVINISVEEENWITGDPSTVTYSIPSFNYVLNKLTALSNTLDAFIKGDGIVLLDDGSYRKISAKPVAISPARITGVETPTKFSTRNNWFFESMMYPQLIVSFNLKNKIDDHSDRVKVKRVIFNNYSEEETEWFKNNMIGVERSYYDTITFLNENDKMFWEDDEIQNLPLLTEPYSGYFVIMNKTIISGKEWYYLDTLNYGVTSDDPIVKDHQLAVDTYLRYGNSVWKIDEINVNEKRVHLIPYIGIEHPTIGNNFEIYSTPFSTKILDVPIGYDECEVMFFKGINEDYNILGDEWSDGIAFYTNDLTINGGTSTLKSYYDEFVSDFGKQLEGQAREKYIPAYYGLVPNAPILSASNFNVVQINTQLNATLDTEDIKAQRTQIETLVSEINSLKETIAQRRAELVELTDPADRAYLSQKIQTDVVSLKTKEFQRRTLVRNLSTTAYDNSAVTTDPKYRIRGFFPIPELRGTPPQEIIQFEIAYRYLKLDNTGNPLNTFEYTDPSSGQVIKGVFTDWIIVSSGIKQKIFDNDTQTFKWVLENIADGEIININQVDIPIQKGEKVQIKIRSISEAGWPLNPLKSEWSQPIIVDFPANLQPTNQIVNILRDATAEEGTIKVNETLEAAGVTVHVDDSVPNPNSGSGTFFKHQAQHLAIDVPVKTENGDIVSQTTVDMQGFIDDMNNKVYVTLSRPAGVEGEYLSQVTVTLQTLFQRIVNQDPSLYKLLTSYNYYR